MNHLKRKNILAGIHYPTPTHLQPAYLNRLTTSIDMKVTEKLADRILSLPIYPELSIKDAQKVVEALKCFNKN